MVKKSRSVYVIGSIIIGLAAIFLVYFLLMMTGVIMVKNENLIITSGTIEAIYNGEEIKCEQIEILDGELNKGHKIEAVFTGKLTNVGVTDNSYNYKIVDQEGVDVTENYVVKKLEGKITIHKKQIKITTTSPTKVYDGTPLKPSANGYELSKDTPLVEGHKLEVSLSSEITNVGTVNNDAHYTIYDQKGSIVTQNYDVVVTAGALTVTPLSITITSKDASKVYDGEPLVKDECSITMGELLDFDEDGIPEHKLVTKTTGTITEPGEEKNTFEYEIYDINTNDPVTDNYDVKVVYGKLTVTSNDLIFIGNSIEKVYDGQPISPEDIKIEPTAESKKVLEDNNYTYEIKVEDVLDTKAGKYKIPFKVTVYNASGTDITEFCNLEEISGELVISKKQVIVKTASDKTTYTGKPYYTDNTEFSKIVTSGSEIVLEETIETIKLVKYNLEIIDANPYENIVEIDILKADGTSSLENYDVKYQNGSIIINQKDLILVSNEINETYTGYSQTVETGGYTVKEGLIEGHNAPTFENNIYTIPDLLTAKSENKVLFNVPKTTVITDSEGKDVTKNYNIITRECSKVTVQIDLELASKSDTKTYDGKEFVFNNVDLIFNEETKNQSAAENSNIIEIEFFDGHKAVITFDEHEPFINAGTLKKTFTYKILYGETDVTPMFDVTSKVGTLTINPLYVLVSTKNVEKEYTGELQNAKDKGIMVDTDTSIKIQSSGIVKYLNSENSIDLVNGDRIVFSDRWTEITQGFVVNRPLSYQISTKDGKVQSFIRHDGITNTKDITSNYVVKEEFGYLSIYIEDFDFTYVVDSITIPDTVFDIFPDGFTMQDLVDLGATSGYVCLQDDSGYDVEVTYTVEGGVITEVGNYKVKIKVTLTPKSSDVDQNPSVGYVDGYINVVPNLSEINNENGM